MYKTTEELFIGRGIIYLSVITKLKSDQMQDEMDGAGETHGREENFT